VTQKPPSMTYPVDALLTEYSACYKTRDHYESMQWTIGSIFIVGALVILGGSFQIKIQSTIDRLGVLCISAVSLVLAIIWLAYLHNVQRYIRDSRRRALEIEGWLNHYYGRVWLQLQTGYLATYKPGTAKALTYSLFVLMLAAVVMRVILAFL
jgi:hypothetical protein